MKEGRVQRYVLVMATMAFIPLAYVALVAPHIDLVDRRLVIAILMFTAMFISIPRLTTWADTGEWRSGNS